MVNSGYPLPLPFWDFRFFSKEKKKEKDPLPFLLSKGSCLALHGLACALPADPPACLRSGAADAADGAGG